MQGVAREAASLTRRDLDIGGPRTDGRARRGARLTMPFNTPRAKDADRRRDWVAGDGRWLPFRDAVRRGCRKLRVKMWAMRPSLAEFRPQRWRGGPGYGGQTPESLVSSGTELMTPFYPLAAERLAAACGSRLQRVEILVRARPDRRRLYYRAFFERWAEAGVGGVGEWATARWLSALFRGGWCAENDCGGFTSTLVAVKGAARQSN